jgi:hypothetical protein
MFVNSVKILPTGQENAWDDIGYAALVSLEAQTGDSGKNRESIGEIVVVANPEGLTVIYERNKRSYELKINLLGDSPQFTQEDITPIKKL